MATTVKNLFDKLNGSKWNAGVTFERTNPVPLEKYSVFHTLAEAETYARSNAVAYPGQLLAVVTDTAVTTYKINVDGTLSQIDAQIKPGDLPISAGVGIEFGENNGKTTINAKLKNGNGLTVDNNGYLSVQKVDFDKVVDSTTSASDNAAYTSAVYQALTAIDNRVSSGYVPLSVANSATSADKLQKASDVSSIASSYITSYFDGMAAGSADKTLTGLTTVDGKVVPAYKDISIVSGQVQNISKAIDDKIALSVATLTADAVTAGTGEAITSISQTDGKITASKGKITVASADVSGLSGFVDSKVKAVDDKLTGYVLTSNVSNDADLSANSKKVLTPAAVSGVAANVLTAANDAAEYLSRGGSKSRTLTGYSMSAAGGVKTAVALYTDIEIKSSQVSDLNDYIKLSSDLSTAWKYKLSAATATDPVVLSSDISGLIAAGVTFGGVVATSANITAGKAGQVYVLTGTTGTTKEGIVTANADGSTTGFVELGDEGAVADLASKIGTLSTKVDKLSNSISAVKVGTTTLTTTNGQIELTKQTISTLFDKSQLCTYSEISTQARKDLSGTLSTDLSLAEYAKTADFTGKVGLSTAAQVSGAISGAISTALDLKALAHKATVDLSDISSHFNGKVGLSTSVEVRNAISGDISTALNLKALAHKDTVSTADIDDGAVTNAKIANKSVTAEKLSGLFVLSCGDSTSEDVTISRQ